ncbi:ribosomal protein S18-alanine N-acetyltransferase [Desulfocucumis palustris]|nr:ribosomal protein S18-alanine N-acetyltransferase [Desulfocucumis palustris]
MQLNIGEMLPEHLDQVLEIEKMSFPVPWSRQSFEFEIMQNEFAHYIVAVYNQKVLGYAGLWVVLDEGHITNVAVHPDFRGNRLGFLLMTEIMRRASIKGADKITLEVRPSNEIALKLYRSLGFKELGLRKKYYSDNNEDAIIMWNENPIR